MRQRLLAAPFKRDCLDAALVNVFTGLPSHTVIVVMVMAVTFPVIGKEARGDGGVFAERFSGSWSVNPARVPKTTPCASGFHRKTAGM
ncbi:hypothetical protein [Prosthecochloris sp. GSB1]|uniref:hypothetical protein n=1 Tax=Prosthecochloris sp. GSB1 TaxID=281093 RepID=UPI0012377A78|nr:hypothetical protein [Prosthecochloris sp. GSB1]